jgi:DNA mismatch endonuclease (patch repair protein)
MPKANREWWQAKLAANRARDTRKDQALIAGGWLPVHVWEHEDPEAVAQQLAGLIESRLRMQQR